MEVDSENWHKMNWEEYEDESELLEPEDYVDQYYHHVDHMMDQEGLDDLDNGLSPFTMSEILHHCIEPTLSDGLKHTGKIIVWCIIFRIVTQMVSTPMWVKHATSIITGIFVYIYIPIDKPLFIPNANIILIIR